MLQSTDPVVYDTSSCLFSFCSSREPHPSNSDDVPRSKVLLFMFCFYFWNTDTLNQNCYARTIEVTTSVSSGNDGDKWDSGAFVSSTVEHNFAKDVMLMMKHALTGFHDLSRSPSLLAAPSSSPEKCVYLAVTCCCGSQNEIQRPFVPISFSYQAKCSLETGLITRQDPQSR